MRQLRRQIDSQFYERTVLSRDKEKMLAKGTKARSGDAVSADEEVKDPLVLEFLGLRDEVRGALVKTKSQQVCRTDGFPPGARGHTRGNPPNPLRRHCAPVTGSAFRARL